MPEKTTTGDQIVRKIPLTKQSVERLPFEVSGYKVYWDSKLPGFGVRVSINSKTYFVQARHKGKSFRATIGTHNPMTAEQARDAAKLRLLDIASGVDITKEKINHQAKAITLSDIYNEYTTKQPLRPKTLQVYEGALRRCFPDWMERPIISISKDMVEKRHKEISTSKGPRSGERGAEAQANQAMRVLRTLLNYAGGKEDADGKSILPENPVKRLSRSRLWNRAVRRQSVVRKEQLKPWMDAVRTLDNPMRDYFEFCLFTGLRRSEAASLKWSDINMNGSYLTILGTDTKNHEEHRLPLSTHVRALLQARLDSKKNDEVYVFPGNGVTKHLVEVKTSVAKVKRLSGVPFMMHDLRRTFITVAEGLDIPHYTLKRLVNHKTSGDVTSGYIVTEVERMREPMQKITDYLLDCIAEAPAKKAVVRKTKRHTDTHTVLTVAK